MTWIDYSWIAVIVLLILAVVIERLAKKGQKVIKILERTKKHGK